MKVALKNVRQPFGLLSDPLREAYGKLWDFLTSRCLPGGKRREVPRITLEATEKGWRASLCDYTLSVKGTREFEHFHDMAEALAGLFERGALGWSQMRAGEAWKKIKADEQRNRIDEKEEIWKIAMGGGDPKKQNK